MGTWIDTIAITIITLVGLGIFYKGLKEPIDLFLGFLGRAIASITEKVRGTQENYAETITYG